MADILDEKIKLPASQVRGPLSFEVEVPTVEKKKHSVKVQEEKYTFKVVTNPAFTEGTYTLRDIIDRLSKCAHLHDKTIFTGSLPQSGPNCDCNCDCRCGDDGG